MANRGHGFLRKMLKMEPTFKETKKASITESFSHHHNAALIALVNIHPNR